MQYHQWQAYNLGKPSPKPPHLVKIKIKATGEIITAASYSAGWLTPSGAMYTRHTAKYLRSIKSD